MTKEEIQAMLETEEGKALLAESGLFTKDQVDEVNKGLINKKNELLKKIADPELKAAREKAKMLDEIIDAAGVEGSESLLDQLAKAKNPEESEDVRQMRRELKKITEEYGALSEDYATTINAVSKNLIDNKLIIKLQAEGCTEVQSNAISKYILSQTKFDLITESGTRKAVDDTGRTPEEFFTEWVTTDEAKELLPAKLNSGAGSTGSRGKIGRNFKTELEQAIQSGDRAAVIRIEREKQQAHLNARK